MVTTKIRLWSSMVVLAAFAFGCNSDYSQANHDNSSIEGNAQETPAENSSPQETSEIADAGGLSEEDVLINDDIGTDVELYDTGTDIDTDTEYVDASNENVCPEAVPSRHSVTIEVVNTSDSDRFVVMHGFDCEAFGVYREDARLPKALGWQCGCECPAPLPPHISELKALAPGESTELVWDGRALATCTETIDCEEEGWGEGSITEPAGAPVPVLAGEYTIELGFVTEIPDHCSDYEGDVWCDLEWGSPDNITFADYQTSCPGVESVRVDIVVPEEGNQVVLVELD